MVERRRYANRIAPTGLLDFVYSVVLTFIFRFAAPAL